MGVLKGTCVRTCMSIDSCGDMRMLCGRSDMALLYNDKAVLENHHVSAAFRLMKEDDCNILANMRREDHK